MQEYILKIRGIVQGVGFRPFVAKLAKELNLNGYVENRETGVEVGLFCGREELEVFLNRLRTEKPAPAKIMEVNIREIHTENGKGTGFVIKPSKKSGEITALIPPDIGLCEDCLDEMFDPNSRRYLYPFISCSHCGPRFSIIESIPYDRPFTTMKSFPMCVECESEYTNVSERRYHAQTNCCDKCGPHYWLEEKAEKRFSKEAIVRAKEILLKGGILAVKGIGGFHLVCDPFCKEAVQRLRKLKERPFKPFALMAKDLETIVNFAEVSPEETKLLLSTARPIVLLKKKGNFFESVAPGINMVGVMLPYAGIHYLLLQEFPILIATSGNLSGEILCASNDEARKKLSGISDALLLHDREILNRCDDSVLKVVNKKKLFVRRSRGFVPEIVAIPFHASSKIFCAGGDLKAVFGYVKGDFFYPSQYFGDLQFKLNQDQYLLMAERYERLFDLSPSVVVVDMHPGYFSRWLGELLARKKGAKLVECQHHTAHIYSVMAEYGLKNCIGVAFDGTGYGTDGTVWGGEFFLVNGAKWQRKGRLRRVSMPEGENAAKRPDLMALAYLFDAGENLSTDELKLINTAAVMTSSAGRLFDAVSSLLGICQRNTYEGEAAMKLESAASSVPSNLRLPFALVKKEGLWEIDLRNCIKKIVALKKEKEATVEELSRAFHQLLSNVVLELCKKLRAETGEQNVCLSGGVFQNSLLLSMCVETLKKSGFIVYVNEQVSPNDEGIALGQAYFYLLKERESR